ncbi:MAG: cellulase family glycosylhydrolase [Sphingobacteriia bacterium]|nr:cellulase family glycosylhydrolase [Sphingobacteriia bacterium]
MLRAAFLILFLSILIAGYSQKTNSLCLGINICGSEFGEDKLPGKLNVDYVYPNEKEINYFALKGFKIVNLPFKWERIQKELGADLNIIEIDEIKKVLNICSKKGLKVILSMHNFGRYRKYNTNFVVGSSIVPKETFKDVWKKIAFTFKEYTNIYGFDIMSEPHNMWGFSWATSAQAAIEGIREINKTANIIVGGENYSDPSSWPIINDALRFLYDPSNKIIYDAHCYFDKDRSGRYINEYGADGAYEKIGIDRIKPFLDWLKKNRKQGMIGEFGVPANDSRWLMVMDKFLTYISEQQIIANYWAAGSWWYNYPLSIQPVQGIDKPQMAVLQKYLTSANNYTITTSNQYRENKPPVYSSSVSNK